MPILGFMVLLFIIMGAGHDGTPDQVGGDEVIWQTLSLIVKVGAVDVHHLARPSDADIIFLYNLAC